MNKGIKDSGFVKKLYGKIGIDLPHRVRTSPRRQAHHQCSHLREGDRLYFWENKRNKIGHTGMYMATAILFTPVGDETGLTPPISPKSGADPRRRATLPPVSLLLGCQLFQYSGSSICRASFVSQREASGVEHDR